MRNANGVTWGMIDTIVRMAAWGLVLGGMMVAVLIVSSYGVDLIREGFRSFSRWVNGEPEPEEPWLPEDRRKWRP